MRAERGRKKKLIVAFHFLRTDQAGWKCGQCRRQGLEARRRCGFIPESRRGAQRPVWARGSVVSEECPTSLITPTSIELVEMFFTSKLTGGRAEAGELTAREADAFVILEREWRMEQSNGG